MANETGSSSFENMDWSKFDFTRWNLDGIGLEGTSSTVATLLQKVFDSPQWPQVFGSSLPGLKTVVIQHLNAQVESLRNGSAGLDKELSDRISTTQSLIASLQAKVRLSTVPPTFAADPNLFQLVVKAVDQKTLFGLPGLIVQLSDPSDSGSVVATATTDSNGNAVLSLSRQKAASLAKQKTNDLAISIVNSDGKSIYSAPNAVCAHANQVETHIAAIPASQDTAPSVAFAAQQSASDNELLRSLMAKPDQLKVFYSAQKEDIQAQITQIQSTIAAIQAELGTTPNQ
jgi:prophage DNA circulation protein